jgi:hypothetical protein
MCEESMLRRFGDADRPLIAELRFVTATPSQVNTPSQDDGNPPAATAAAPGDGRQQTR